MNLPPTPFTEFPKMARLSREMIVTEKIDGTNASIYIKQLKDSDFTPPEALTISGGLAILAGSRTRWITPADDNFGFAAWVASHLDEIRTLGEGLHFGEWWGSGIQRGYNLPKGEKRLSLFNVTRWCLYGETPQIIPTGDPRVVKMQDVLPSCVGLVPVLHRGPFSTVTADMALAALAHAGSLASPGFMKPEGIVVYHTAGGVGFKKTIEKDETPKSLVR